MTRLGKSFIIICAAILTSTFATAGFAQPRSQSTAPGDANTRSDESAGQCPDFLRGANLNIKNTNEGIVVTITTDQQANVPMVRQLVRDVAEAVEDQSHKQQQQPTQGSDQVNLPEIDTASQDVTGGEQVTVRAKDPQQVGVIQQQAQEAKTAWASSSCAKPQSLPQAMK